MKKRRARDIVTEILCLAFSATILLPFYMLIVNSFKSKAEAAEMSLALPTVWQIVENYGKVFDIGNILRSYLNSIFITSVEVFLIVIFSAAAAMVIQRRGQKLTSLIYAVVTAGLILPTSIAPTYFVARALRLSGYTALIPVYLSSMFSVSVFLYVGYFKSVPREIDESALIEGCGPLRLFFAMLFPLISPMTLTVTILNAMTIWNDLGTAIYFLSRPATMTVGLTTFFFYGQKAADWNLVFADIVLVSLPIIILYFLLQRYIISGLTAGAVRG